MDIGKIGSEIGALIGRKRGVKKVERERERDLEMRAKIDGWKFQPDGHCSSLG